MSQPFTSAFTAEEASEGSAAPSVRTPVHCGVVCGTCSSPVQRPPGGTPSWGQEVGPAPKTAQKKCADSWQGARGGAGGQSVTRRRLARVTGVVSDGTTRGLVLRAAKGSDAPGAGRSEGPDRHQGQRTLESRAEHLTDTEDRGHSRTRGRASDRHQGQRTLESRAEHLTDTEDRGHSRTRGKGSPLFRPEGRDGP